MIQAVKKVVVTGAGGFIGRWLVHHLTKSGFAPIAMVYNLEQSSYFESIGVEVCIADVTDPTSLEKAFCEADYVIHLAALFNCPDATWDEYRAVNIDGINNVLAAARKMNVKRVVHCSTVGIAIKGEQPYSETSPYNPPEWDKYETTKCEGEKAALQFCREHNFPVVVIRPAQVYGPGDPSKLKFYKMVQKGVLVNPAKTYKHPIFVDDLCAGFIAALDAEGAEGEVIIIANDEPILLRTLVDIVANALGVGKPKVFIPAVPMTIFATCVEFLFNAIGKKPPIFRRSMDFFTRSVNFDNSKAKDILGFKPSVRVVDGVEKTVAWYRDNGLL